MSRSLLSRECRLAIVEEPDRRILDIGRVILFKSAQQVFVSIHQLLYRPLKMSQRLLRLNLRLAGKFDVS